MRRGDVVTVAVPGDYGKPRPAVIVQTDAFPDSHPQHLGMPGMHGSVAAVTALQKADLLVALGTRFDDRATGKLDTFAPNGAAGDAEAGRSRRAPGPG